MSYYPVGVTWCNMIVTWCNMVVNYAFRKREVVIDNLEHCAQFENILQSQVHGWKAKISILGTDLAG